MTRTKALLLIILVFLAFGFFWWENGLQAVNPANKSQKLFVVQKNEGVREIANNLKQQDLIRDPVVFFLLVKLGGLDGKIQAGDFPLSASQTAQQIAQSLTEGRALDIWVTIPEGKRANEIADILKEKIPDYQDSWRNQLDANEGYLFPDTYLIAKDGTVNTIISRMRDNFNKKYSQIPVNSQNTLSQQQIVILASIIEREAISESDMRLVSSVLQNRLQINMPLGSDVTLEYALGYQPQEKTWWKKDLTVDDLALQSPYNTRINTGLPPTPICNPGLIALSAAMNPAQSDYLYYLSDSKGKLHFAKTLSEHNANIKKYGVE